MSAEQERRQYPRVKGKNVSLKVKAGDFDTTISHGLNISASGLYCKLEKEIPLLSRVNIILMLPHEKSMYKIVTEGVVVREHPVIENGKIVNYDAAIFFDNISSREREIVKQYIEGTQKC